MNRSDDLNEQTSQRKDEQFERRSFFWRWRYDYPWLTGVLIAVLIAALLGVFLLARRFDSTSGVVDRSQSGQAVSDTSSAIRIEIPFFGQEQYLVGSAVLGYMDSALTEDVNTVLAGYSNDQDRSAAYPVTLRFDITGMPTGYTLTGLRAEVSENTAFDSPRVIPLGTEDREVSIYHLKTGTTYWFRIVLTVSDGSEVFTQGTFRTADTPRLVNIDGVVNTRDFGGWKTADGKTVRQGLLYRGSEMDGNSDEKCLISETGKGTMLNVLKVKTQLDLRWNVQDNPLGDGVEHRSYSTATYSQIFTEDGSKNLRKLFTDLADPSIYPAYIHCTHGTHQTGTACALLGLLLGMSQEDVIRAYELSALYQSGSVSTAELEEMIAKLDALEGDSLMKKTENYLLSIGVTAEQISSIRSIFLEG